MSNHLSDALSLSPSTRGAPPGIRSTFKLTIGNITKIESKRLKKDDAVINAAWVRRRQVFNGEACYNREKTRGKTVREDNESTIVIPQRGNFTTIFVITHNVHGLLIKNIDIPGN